MNTTLENDTIDLKKESVNNLLKSNEEEYIVINNNDFSSVKKNIIQELDKKHKLVLDEKFKESALLLNEESALYSSLILTIVTYFSFNIFVSNNYGVNAGIVSLFISTLALIPIIFVFFYLLSIQVKKPQKLPQKFYDLNMEYLSPLSCDDIEIFINNEPYLKKYIIENDNKIYTQYLIDTILNRNEEYRKMFDDLNLSLDNIIDNKNKDNNFETFKIKNIINDEQNKVKDIEINTYTTLKDYKVFYQIKNGPIKEVIFKHSNDDRNVFSKYISSLVDKEYGRDFEILNIELIK